MVLIMQSPRLEPQQANVYARLKNARWCANGIVIPKRPPFLNDGTRLGPCTNKHRFKAKVHKA